MRLAIFLCFNAIITTIFAQPDYESEKRQLLIDISFLAHDSLEGRETGSRGEAIAAAYIANRFKQLGLTPLGSADASYFQTFEKNVLANPHDASESGHAVNGKNVIGFLDNDATKTIVIGAHYDHLGWGGSGSLHDGDSAIHNGADDNASGVAGLLFLAKRLSELDLNSNVVFIAFSGEEMGLLGSNYFVNHPLIDLTAVNYMINMDMVGRLDDQRSLAIYGVGTSASFIPAIHAIEAPAFQFALDSSGFGPSDHTSFYVNDIPVLHFFTGQHAQYHKPDDDVEWINFDGLFDVSVFIKQLIISLDSEEKLQFSKTRDSKNEEQNFKVTLGIMPDYMFTGNGLRIDGAKEGRPAHTAGLSKGDILLKMGKFQITDIYSYMDALNAFEKGNSIKVVYLRNGRKRKANLTF